MTEKKGGCIAVSECVAGTPKRGYRVQAKNSFFIFFHFLFLKANRTIYFDTSFTNDKAQEKKRKILFFF